MKKIFVLLALVACSFTMHAQSLQEAIKLIRYERYGSAKTMLQQQSGTEATYYLGLAELGLGNAAAARDQFNKITDNYMGMVGLARVLFFEGKKDEAMKMLQNVVDGARRKEWEKYKMAADAITYTKGGQINKAIEWYKKALEIEPEAATYLALGDAYLTQQTGGGEAMNNYEAALGKTNDKSLVYSRMGALWYQARNYEKALENYDLAKNADPSNPIPYRDLANAYYRIGKYTLAKENIEKYLSLTDKSIDDQVTYANLLFLSKDYANAVSKMQELISGGHEQPYMHRILGYSNYELKNYPVAYNEMQTFFKKMPADDIIPEDYIYMGKILTALAISDTSKTKVYSDSANFYLEQGISLDTAQDKAKLYRNIAEGFRDAKNYEQAGIWYGKIVQGTTDFTAEDYFYWGVYTYYSKLYPEAAKIFNDMAQQYPEEPSPVYWQGRAAAAQDVEAKNGGAVPFYEKWLGMEKEGVTKSTADLMQAYQYLAIYYYNQSNKAEAIKYSEKILELEPGNETAKQIKDVMTKSK